MSSSARIKNKPVGNPFRGPDSFYGLYAVLSLAAFFPCLFLGRAYFDNDLLAQFGPWRAFLKDQLALGHFPLWNPYNLGGLPFFADLQNMMVYPVNYLTLPFSVPYGLGVFFFLHLSWAACGAHLWLRSLRLSEDACRTGALVFSFSNFLWLEIIHPPVFAAYAWIPWLFFSLEKLLEKPKPLRAFYTGLIFALLFNCGSFQMTIGTFYAALAYFLFRLFSSKPTGWTPRRALILFLFLAWGALPLLGQLIPTAEFSALSVRRAPGQTYDQVNIQWGLNPHILGQFLFPRWSLGPGQSLAEAIQYQNTPADTGSNFLGNYGYLGVWVPFLIFTAFRNKDRKASWFWGLFVVFSIALCLGKYFPLHRLVCQFLPGFSLIRVPYRFLYLYVLGASALAAFGFERWFQWMEKDRRKGTALKIALAYAGVLYLTALFRPVQTWREILALTAGFLALALFHFFPARRKTALYLFQAALFAPLFLNGWNDFKPGPASNFDFVGHSRSIPEIGRQVQPGRLIFDNTHMGYPVEVDGSRYLLYYPQNIACALKIKNFGGYNPLVLQSKMDMTAVPLEGLIHLGAIAGILTQEKHGPIPGFRQELHMPFLLYRTEQPVQYLFAPPQLEVAQDRAERIALLTRADFDPYRRTLLSEPLPDSVAGAISKTQTRLRYEIREDGVDHQSFTVDLDRNSLVVFAEMMFPGWRARVDGTPAPVYTADHVLRSVYLPKGLHQVDFDFEPGWGKPIFFGALLWFVLTLGFLFFSRNRNGRRKNA